MGEESSTQDAGVPIMIEADDTEGHTALRAFVSEEDEKSLQDALRTRGRGPINVRLEPVDEDDTEGHAITASRRVRLVLGDEDDTEGHVISLHFPTAEAADQFRRRLLATGVLAATLTVGAIGVANLPNIEATGAGAAGVVTSQAGPLDANEARGLVNPLPAAGMDWTQAERPGQAAAGTSAGSGAGMDWTQAERPGQAGATGAAASGPMDATEAGGLVSPADPFAADSARLQGQADAQAAAGPMDAHEASDLVNPAGTSSDEDESAPSSGGFTPR